MKNGLIYNESFEFALRIVKLYKYLCDKKEFVISKQLLRSGTSIGANVREGTYGQSKKDFLAKMNIALKEAGETEYWIELLIKSDYLSKQQGESILNDCIKVKKILHSIVKSTRNSIRD